MIFNCVLLNDEANANCLFVNCNYRLPKEKGIYIVLYENFSVGKPKFEYGRCMFDGQWVNSVGHISYWLELPELVCDENTAE